jgi:uncharacterized protein (DUF1778 family)
MDMYSFMKSKVKSGQQHHQQYNRTARLEARIAPAALAVVRRAAEIQGRSLSDFVVAAAQDAARRTIEETEIIRLSIAGQQQIADLLLNPPLPSPNLKRALRRRRELLGGE